MLTFTYTAKDSKGQETTADIQAESQQAAAKLLISQQLVPIKIEVKTEGGGRSFSLFKDRVKAKDRVLYTRQLATLIGSGLPLTQALRTAGEQSSNPTLAVANGQIIADVEGGRPLAEAMGRHPRIFNEIYVQLIAAGEASGTLDETLERIATQQEKDAEAYSKIRGALIYPVIVIIVIGLVLAFLLTTVVPQIESLYKDLKRDLPFITQILVGVSKVLTHYWYILLPVLFAIGYVLRLYGRTEGGKSVFDRMRMNAPLFGPLFMKLYMARFCRTGATLLASGVPLLEMMRVTGKAINNVHVEKGIGNAAIKVKGGKALSDSLASTGVFLSLVPQMIKVGEQSGAIDAMMAKTAKYYEDELDNQIKALSTVIEPALLVILAILAGIIIGAILLPVYGLVGQSLSF